MKISANRRLQGWALALSFFQASAGVVATGRPWKPVAAGATIVVGDHSSGAGLSTLPRQPLASPAPPVHAALPEYAIPVKKGRISDRFLAPRPGHLHAGIDIATDEGIAVSATKDGIVIFAGEKGSYGFTIDIDHGNGIISRYAHLKQMVVGNRQAVKQGQHIGDVGKTGNATGFTLHFEIRVNGKPADPLRFLGDSISMLHSQSVTHSAALLSL